VALDRSHAWKACDPLGHFVKVTTVWESEPHCQLTECHMCAQGWESAQVHTCRRGCCTCETRAPPSTNCNTQRSLNAYAAPTLASAVRCCIAAPTAAIAPYGATRDQGRLLQVETVRPCRENLATVTEMLKWRGCSVTVRSSQTAVLACPYPDGRSYTLQRILECGQDAHNA